MNDNFFCRHVPSQGQLGMYASLQLFLVFDVFLLHPVNFIPFFIDPGCNTCRVGFKYTVLNQIQILFQISIQIQLHISNLNTLPFLFKNDSNTYILEISGLIFPSTGGNLGSFVFVFLWLWISFTGFPFIH